MRTALASLRSVARLVGLGQAAPVPDRQVYRGHVANTPVDLHCSIVDDLLYGTLVYARSGISLQVVGRLDELSLTLHEYDKRGNIVGLYTGKRTGKGFIGLWSGLSAQGPQIPFDLQAEGAVCPAKARTPPDLTGTYAYKFGSKGRSAILLVEQTEARKLCVALQAATDWPARHAVTIDRTPLRLTDNQAVLTSTPRGMGALRITFFEDGASVDSFDELGERAFQDVATVTGSYVRIETGSPFSMPLGQVRGAVGTM